jgi:hypothetical protein
MVGSVTVATHPLNSRWCLWHTPNITPELSAKYGSWETASLKATTNVQALTSVEGFWACFNALPPPTKLPKDENIMFFREDIEPKWEDAAFKEKPGGRFLCRLDPVPTGDKFIQTLLVHTVGEQVSVETNSANLIGGIRYVKKDTRRDVHVRVEVWVTDAAHADDLKHLLLNIADECDISNLGQGENLTWKPF